MAKGLIGRAVNYLNDIRMLDPAESKTKLAAGWGTVAAVTGLLVEGASKLAEHGPNYDPPYMQELMYYASHTMTAPPELMAKTAEVDQTGMVVGTLAALALAPVAIYGIEKKYGSKIRDEVVKFKAKARKLDEMLGEVFDGLVDAFGHKREQTVYRDIGLRA